MFLNMITLTTLEIEHYKVFFDKKLINFAIPNEKYGSGFTLIMGPNNTGKTSFYNNGEESIESYNQDSAINTNYKLEKLSTSDIRDKRDKNGNLIKEGFFDESGNIKDQHKEEFGTMIDAFVAYFTVILQHNIPTENVIARSVLHGKRSAAMQNRTKQSRKIDIDVWIATSLYCYATLRNTAPRNDVLRGGTVLNGYILLRIKYV